MNTSTELDKIAPALVAVSKAIGPVLKNKTGYGYKYADLVAICNELAPKLLENDFVVLEGGGDDDNSNPEMVSCQLRIQHVSGQWIETGILRVKVNPAVKKDGSLKPLGPQDYMIVYSYLRRYLLVSAFMIPTVDNDASGPRDDPPKAKAKKQASASPQSPPADDTRKGLVASIGELMKAKKQTADNLKWTAINNKLATEEAIESKGGVAPCLTNDQLATLKGLLEKMEVE